MNPGDIVLLDEGHVDLCLVIEVHRGNNVAKLYNSRRGDFELFGVEYLESYCEIIRYETR